MTRKPVIAVAGALALVLAACPSSAGDGDRPTPDPQVHSSSEPAHAVWSLRGATADAASSLQEIDGLRTGTIDRGSSRGPQHGRDQALSDLVALNAYAGEIATRYGLPTSGLTTIRRLPVSADGVALALPDVLRNATLRAPVVAAADADIAAAGALVREAWGAYTPRLEVSLGADVIGRDRNGLDRPKEFVGGVSMSVGLIDAARRWRLDAARERLGSLRWAASATRDGLVLDIMQAWIETVSARKTAEALERTASSMRGMRASVVSRQREGYASEADIARLDADIAAIEQEVVFARLEATTANATLSSLAGRKLEPQGYPDVERFVAKGKAWLSNRAQRANPQLNASRAETRALMADASAARGDLLPGVDLTGRYDHAFNPSGIHRTDSAYTIGVKLSMPIFDVTQYARADRLKSEAHAAGWRATDQARQVALQVETLWQTHEASKRAVALAARAVAENNRVLASLEAQYREGRADLADVLDRQRVVVDAEFEHRRAVLRRSGAAIRLVSIAGLSQSLIPGR